MEFIKEINISKPVDQVWDLLGNQYGDAYKWASGLAHSNSFGQPRISGAACNNRSCDTSFGQITEEIQAFDAENYVLSYHVIKGFPFFIDVAQNTWTLKAKGDITHVHVHLTMKTKGIVGFIMAPMMKMQMNNTLNQVIKDFKHYLETGQPSAYKSKEMAKLSRKAA